MSKVQRSAGNTASALKKAEQKQLAALEARKNEIEQNLSQLEEVAPQLKPQLEQLRERIDQKFSVERAALESKLNAALDKADGNKPGRGSGDGANATGGAQQVSNAIPHTGNAFIDAVAKGAVEGQQKYGVPASVTIAQAILESGWGKSGLAQSAHNLFGIKGQGPAGSVTMPTREVINGQSVTVNAAFRKYHNDAESLEDHAKLLAESGYYKKAMADRNDPNKFANDLTGVYATDPTYGRQLTQIMQQYNLYQFDKPGSAKPPPSSGSGGGAKPPTGKPGGTVTVQPGDSLSRIAARHGISLAALEKANPQIKNFNLIYPGQEIHLPGGSKAKPPSGGGSGKTGGSGKAGSSGGVSSGGSTSGDGSAAYRNATEVLGHNISQLKYSGPLAQYLDKWPGNNVCCANFVSACLEKAGEISHSQHNDSVKGLAANLRNDKQWSETSLKNAKPGDVVCFNVPGEGPMSHVVMFAGWKNGKPTFIGSNNANPDGTQRITEGYMGYPVGAVFHYHG